MGLFFQDPGLLPGEHVQFRSAANLFKGRRQIGGQVTVTDRRMIFKPNRLDAHLRGPSFDLMLTDIAGARLLDAGLAQAKLRGLGALLHPQVEITPRTAPDDAIVIRPRRPDALLSALRQ